MCLFQRQLVYQLKDGSFSAFGEDPDNSPGSVWITAQTMSAFRRCQKFVDVDEAVIGRALGWLQSKQAADGSFKEPKGSKIINKVMQVRFTTQLHIQNTLRVVHSPVVEKLPVVDKTLPSNHIYLVTVILFKKVS